MNKNLVPLISVIVPVYNVEKYLEKCINSIISQSYSNLEIILVDDGSTDKSSQICNEYLEKDSRIKVIHKENGGVTNARKAGFLQSTGMYITFVDGDDWLERNAYSTIYERGIKHGADIIQVGVIAEYPGGKTSNIGCSFNEGIYVEKKLETEILENLISTKEFYQNNFTINLGGVVLKREDFAEELMEIDDNLRFGEDMAYVWTCMLKCNSIAIIKEGLFHYNKYPGSAMHSSDEAISLKYESIKLVYKTVRKAIERYGRSSIRLERQLILSLSLSIYMLLLTTNYSKLVSDMDNRLFPFKNINRGDRLVIYGAGSFGEQIVNHLKECKDYKIVLWCDLGYEEYRKKGKEVYPPKEIKKQLFDKVIIAVTRKKVSGEIFSYLETLGIQKEKIREVDLSQLVPENLPTDITSDL